MGSWNGAAARGPQDHRSSPKRRWPKCRKPRPLKMHRSWHVPWSVPIEFGRRYSGRNSLLYRHRRFYGRMGNIIFEREVFEPEGENILYRGIQLHYRQRIGCTGQLKPYLLDMIAIEVNIPEGVYEFAGLETTHLRDH